MTDFSKNTIRFDSVPSSKVELPESAKQKKLFLDSDNKLKTIDFSGKIVQVVTEEELKKIKLDNLGVVYQDMHGKGDQNIEISVPTLSGENRLVNVIVYKGDKGNKGDIGLSGKDGKDGKDGVSPTITISQVVESQVPYVKNLGSVTDLKLELGLPRGRNGVDGKNGRNGIDGKDGKDGIVKDIVIGEVIEGDNPDVTIIETESQYVLNFVLPRSKNVTNMIGGGGVSKLSQLNDVKVSGIKVGETIVWDGVNFVPGVATGISGSSVVVDLSGYALITDVAGISANLQSQINSIVQEGTVIVGGPNITASQSGMVWTIGVTGSFGDASLRSEVASISSSMMNYVNEISGSYTPLVVTAAVSSGLDSRISDVVSINNEQQNTLSQLTSITGSFVTSIPSMSGYALTSDVVAISSGLDSRLDIVELTNIDQQNTLSQISSITGSFITSIPSMSAYAFTSDVASISSGLDSRLDIVEITNLDQQNTLSILCSISGIGTVPSMSGYATNSYVSELSANLLTDIYNLDVDLQSQIFILTNDICNLDVDLQSQILRLKSTTNDITGVINSQQNTINQLVSLTGSYGVTGGSTIPSLSAYALNTSVQSMSAGLDSRLAIVEGMPTPDIYSVEVASISSGLNTTINNVNVVVSQHQNTLSQLTSITGSFLTSIPSMSAYALNSNVQAMSAGLNSRLTSVENVNISQQNSLAQIPLITGQFINRFGDSMAGTLTLSGADFSVVNPAARLKYRRFIVATDSNSSITSGANIGLINDNMIGIGVGSAAGLRITPGEMTFNNAYKIWHSGNMGSGSALDADTIDGIDSSFFALNSNVQAMSAGLNSRIGTVENSIQTFDSKFVNISGDSMTGPLIINGGSASPIPFKPNITIESSGSDQISNVKNVEMQTTITNNGSNEQIYSTVNNIKSSILIETTGTGTINSVSDPIHLANYRTGGITLSGNISGYSGIAFHSEGVNLDNGSYLVEYKGLDSGRASVNAGSRIETVYGVHIPQNNNYGGIIDKEYGVYQEQLGVDNYFAGNVEIVGNLLVHGSVNISGASTIPTVAFFARTDSGQTVSNSTRTDLTFEDEVIDTHNGHNSSTGVYTVPLSGVYQVSAQVTYSTLQANDTMQFFIYKNGTEYVSAYDVANVGSSIFSIKTHAVMNCAENDTIEVYAYVGSFSSRSLRAVSQDNYLSIVRIK